MEQMYNESLLPPPPLGDGVCSQAVRSVVWRGFYEGPQTTERYPLLTAQYGRLVEEVGEFLEVAQGMKLQPIADELADIFIVLCQMAWLSSMNPDAMLMVNSNEIIALPILQSKLWRAIRKDNTGDIYNLLSLMAVQCKQIAQVHGINLEQAIRVKLKNDEQRGTRHEGVK